MSKELEPIPISFFDEDLNITRPSDAWGSAMEGGREERSQAADIIIVYGSDYDRTPMYYLKKDQIDLFLYGTRFLQDKVCNIWITDDGEVLEGMGMDYFNYVMNAGLGSRALIIGFIKRDIDAPPSEEAVKCFRKLVTRAICDKKLSLPYSLIPSYLIYDYDNLDSDSFERNGLYEWDGYVENLDEFIPLVGEDKLGQRIVPRNEWSEKEPGTDLMNFSSPIENVLIRDFSARCFYNCKNYLKEFERHKFENKKLMKFNFLLGEDGRVYEVNGWRKTWSNSYLRKNAVRVGCLGMFHSYGPHKNMFLALHRLLKDGLDSGNLSPNYKVVTTLSRDPNTSSGVGKGLDGELKKIRKLHQ